MKAPASHPTPLVSSSLTASPGSPTSSFPFSAACKDDLHSSGLDLQVTVKPGRVCTGEVLEGQVTISRLASCRFPREVDLIACVRSLAIRVSCESRCMFWTIIDDKDQLPLEAPGQTHADGHESMLKENDRPLGGNGINGALGHAIEKTLSRSGGYPESRRKRSLRTSITAGAPAPAADTVRWCWEPEWARATVGEISCISNGTAQVTTTRADLDQVDVPFQVTLPLEITFDEWNRCPGADRKMHRTVRPAPSSCRDRQDASVEWIVEALLDLRYSSRPGGGATGHGHHRAGTRDQNVDDQASIRSTSTTSFDLDQLDPWTNSRGFCISKPSRLVTRIVFEVVAADLKLAGHDLGDESLRSWASSERARLRTHAGKLQEQRQAAGAGGSMTASGSSLLPNKALPAPSAHYKKMIELRSNALSTKIGTLGIELVTHSPMHLSRKNLRSSLSMYLDWKTAQHGLRRALGGGNADKYRLESASMTMEGWSWTRGGNGKIRREVMPLRRLTIPLDVPLSQCSRGRYKVRVPFDLRNDQGRTPSEILIPSFKTANVEREYTLTVGVKLSHGDTEYVIGIVPLQIGSGVMPVLARQLNGILEDEEEEEGGLAESAGPGDQWRVRSLLSDSAM